LRKFTNSEFGVSEYYPKGRDLSPNWNYIETGQLAKRPPECGYPMRNGQARWEAMLQFGQVIDLTITVSQPLHVFLISMIAKMTGKESVLKAKDWKQSEYKHVWPIQLSIDHHCAENYKAAARLYKEFSNRHPTQITMKHLV